MIHHLVVDLVSWQVLLEDLESLGDVVGGFQGARKNHGVFFFFFKNIFLWDFMLLGSEG